MILVILHIPFLRFKKYLYKKCSIFYKCCIFVVLFLSSLFFFCAPFLYVAFISVFPAFC